MERGDTRRTKYVWSLRFFRISKGEISGSNPIHQRTAYVAREVRKKLFNKTNLSISPHITDTHCCGGHCAYPPGGCVWDCVPYAGATPG